jgi:hypothetical protein
MDDDRYQRYLLGELPESERDQLEEEYFVTDEGFQELQVAEDALVDAYAAGILSPERRARFEARYLRTEGDRRRVQEALALQQAVARARHRWAEVSAAPGAGRRWTWAAGWAAAVAAAATAAVLLLQVGRLRGELEQARARQGALEQAADAQASRVAAFQAELERLRAEAQRAGGGAAVVLRAGRVVALALREGLRRNLDPVAQLELAADVDTVRLTLELDAAAREASRASVQTAEGAEVWTGRGRRAAEGGGTTLVVDVPAAPLAAGQHVVIVSSDRRPDDPLAEYVFQVRRP